MNRILPLAALLALWSCTTTTPDKVDSDEPKNPDQEGDADTDADGDADTDADGDADTDADGDTDADADTDTGPIIPTNWSLQCAPGLTHLVVGNGPAQTVQLSSWWQTPSGAQSVSGLSWWKLDGPGTVSPGGLYDTGTVHGGRARIQASASGRTATCVVEVEVDASVNPSGNSSVPGAFSSTTPTVSNGCAATLLYPLDDSAMPGSFTPPLIQWSPNGSNMHELVLTSSWTTLTVTTDKDRFKPTLDQWWGLTRFDPGTFVDLQLTSGNWTGSSFSGGTCTATSTTTVEVTDTNIGGTIVYWAPPQTRAITFDTYTGQLDNDRLNLPGAICHGCHTVNLTRPFQMTYGPNIPGRTNLVNLAAPTVLLNSWGNGSTDMRDYGAPDHTGTYVVISGVALLGGGSTMRLYNQSNGNQLGTLSSSRAPTMPNWSPDGTRLVYAGCDSGASALGGSNCNLYLQTWNPTSRTFSNETLLAQASAGETLYYPTFSPDSQWVAYNKAVMWTDATSGELQTTNANPKAKVMLISVNGGAQIELFEANGVGDLMNSWPRWAPIIGDYAWLAYSTQRDYGHQVSGTQQLWTSAIDLGVAATGSGDPSRPPAWIPGQLITQGNHTPTWIPRYKP